MYEFVKKNQRFVLFFIQFPLIFLYFFTIFLHKEWKKQLSMFFVLSLGKLVNYLPKWEILITNICEIKT